jgi:hypothetical protein
MPRHTITFNLPEEREELRTAQQAANYHSALWDFAQLLRNLTKYDAPLEEGKELTSEQSNMAHLLREKFYEILRDNEVTSEDL